MLTQPSHSSPNCPINRIIHIKNLQSLSTLPFWIRWRNLSSLIFLYCHQSVSRAFLIRFFEWTHTILSALCNDSLTSPFILWVENSVSTIPSIFKAWDLFHCNFSEICFLSSKIASTTLRTVVVRSFVFGSRSFPFSSGRLELFEGIW